MGKMACSRRCLLGLLLFLLLAVPSWAQQEHAVLLPERPATPWADFAMEGGLRRWGDWYWMQRDGVSDLVSMNYVDGYLWGPSGTTLGRLLGPSCARLELRPTVRYADARRAWVAHGALRYVLRPERFAWLEAFGGQGTDDFDAAPVLAEPWRGVASAIFGRNDFKLYERTAAGVRASFAAGRALQLSGRLSYEGRRRLENHRRRNLFRTVGAPNVPQVRGRDASDGTWWLRRRERLLRLDVQADYVPGRMLYVMDDLTTLAHTAPPTFTLRAEVGTGLDGGDDGSGHRGSFLSLEARVAQTLTPPSGPHAWRYLVSAGAFPLRHGASLPDWHHLDASSFWWQRPEPRPATAGPADTRDMGDLTRLRLLTAYELSTDRAWAEAHFEWNSTCMALGRLVQDDALREFLQLHLAQVASAPLHTELTYGIDLGRQLRLSATVGLDGGTWDGAAFTLSISKK